MKKRLLILIAALLLVCMTVISCSGDKKIEKLNLTGGLKYKYEVGETPDFSKVTATATYNDGTTEELTADKLTFGSVDNTTVGKKQLTISYQGFTLTIEIEFLAKGGVTPEDPGTTPEDPGTTPEDPGTTPEDPGTTPEINEVGGTIMGTERPSWYMTSVGNRELDKFQIKDSTYKVGNANPFAFRLQLDILGDNGEVDYTGPYTSLSTVHLVQGNTLTLVGTEYVTVNEKNNTFQFTAAAAGKTFRISTRPLYGVEGIEEDCTRSITVEVVNAYNVTDAKELNLLTNSSFKLLGHTTDQTEMAKDYINNQFGPGYYETYGGDALKGIVLHRMLTPTVNDIPADYLYTYPAGHETMAGAKAFHNGNFVLYNHEISPTSPGFGFYGNYFQINCRLMPDACDATVAEYGKAISNDKLFSFVVAPEFFDTEEKFSTYDHTQYHTIIENVYFFGNDGSSNNPNQSAERLLALAALNTEGHTSTIRNVAVEAFNNAIIIQNDNQTVNIDRCRFYNAWQGQIYCWLNNMIQEDLPGDHIDILPLAGHQPIYLNITNSTLAKCGGPVIMSQIETDKGVVEPYNKNSALHVTVDAASTLYSYVGGTEAWFTAFNMTQDAGRLMALNEAVAGYGAAASGMQIGSPSAFTKTETPEGTFDNPKANLIFLSMAPADTFTVDSKCVYNANNEVVKQYFTEGMGQYGAPLLESSDGGYAIYTDDLKDITNSSNILATGDNCTKFFSGSHITAHIAIPDPTSGEVMKTGILMEYFH